MKLILITLCALLAIQYSSSAPFDIGGWFNKAAKDAGNWINKAAKDTENWVKGAAKDTKDWVEGAAKDTDKWVKGAAKDTERWVKGAARDTESWVKGAAADTEKWVKGAAKDVEKEFNKIGMTITNFFNKAGEEITKAFNVVKNEWNKFERDANAFFKNAGENIKRAIEDIKKRIEETGDSIVKVIFQKIYEGLQEARRKLDDLSRTADNKFDLAMNDVRDKLFTATSQIQYFMDRMKGVIERKEEKIKGMEILEAYVRDSTEKIQSCSESAIEPIRELYEATKSLIGKTIDKLEEFIKDIEGCLNKGVSVEAAKCGRNLGKIAKSALGELGLELLNMKKTLITSAVGEIANFVCVGKTRIEVEVNKLSVERAINNLK